MGCGIYWKDCPVLSVTEQGGDVVAVEGGWDVRRGGRGAAGL